MLPILYSSHTTCTCLELTLFLSVGAVVKADIKRQASEIFRMILQTTFFFWRVLGDALLVRNSSAFHALKVFPAPVSPFKTITFMKKHCLCTYVANK